MKKGMTKRVRCNKDAIRSGTFFSINSQYCPTIWRGVHYQLRYSILSVLSTRILATSSRILDSILSSPKGKNCLFKQPSWIRTTTWELATSRTFGILCSVSQLDDEATKSAPFLGVTGGGSTSCIGMGLFDARALKHFGMDVIWNSCSKHNQVKGK